MTRDELSYSDFVHWISKLDDSYKVYLFSLFNAIFWYVSLSYGVNIDPDSFKELILGSFITTTGNVTLISLWKILVQPLLMASGFIQLGLSLYAIWKFGKLGITISILAFFGLLLLLITSHYGLPSGLLYVGVIMIGISYFIARKASRLRFDKDGNVVYDT